VAEPLPAPSPTPAPPVEPSSEPPPAALMMACGPCEPDETEPETDFERELRERAEARERQRAAEAAEEDVTLYVARYANCYRGNTDVNRHAEEFLLEDSHLLETLHGRVSHADRLLAEATQALEKKSKKGKKGEDKGPAHFLDRVDARRSSDRFAPGLIEVVDDFHSPPPPDVQQFLADVRTREATSGLRLLLYMTYQPCHHSGGRVPKAALNNAGYAAAAPQHPATCSERLRDFYIKELRPYGVALELVLADVYKATWDEELHPSEVERSVYSTKSESAREGMRMLLSEGVTMRAMIPSDWEYLVTLCDPDVQEQFAKRGTPECGPFSKLHVAMRNAMDQYLAGYIAADWRGDTYALAE